MEISSLEGALDRERREGSGTDQIELAVQERGGVFQVTRVVGAFSGEERDAILSYSQPVEDIETDGVELWSVSEINAYETPRVLRSLGLLDRSADFLTGRALPRECA